VDTFWFLLVVVVHVIFLVSSLCALAVQVCTAADLMKLSRVRTANKGLVVDMRLLVTVRRFFCNEPKSDSACFQWANICWLWGCLFYMFCFVFWHLPSVRWRCKFAQLLT
jgi:hypothetical protein